MDEQGFLTPEMAAAQGQPADPNSIQMALQRLTPQQRRMLFEPYQHELAMQEQQATPTQHRTALAAVLGGVGNMMANAQRMQTLHRMQQNAQDMTGAIYGADPAMHQAAMVQALRQRQQALPADPYAPPDELTEA